MNNNLRILFLVQLPPPIHGAALINKQIVENKFLNENYEIKIDKNGFWYYKGAHMFRKEILSIFSTSQN